MLNKASSTLRLKLIITIYSTKILWTRFQNIGVINIKYIKFHIHDFNKTSQLLILQKTIDSEIMLIFNTEKY